MAGGLQFELGVIRTAHCSGPESHKAFKSISEPPTDSFYIKHLHLGQLGKQIPSRKGPRISFLRF